MTSKEGVKLHGGTLHIEGDEVVWVTRRSTYYFTVGKVYDRRPGNEQHTLLSITELGKLSLQRVGSNRKSHAQVHSFVGSYSVIQVKKDTVKKREAEKAREAAEKAAAAARQGNLFPAAAPSSAQWKAAVEELGRDVSALVHDILLDRVLDMVKRLLAALSAKIEKKEVELMEQLVEQHKASHKELVTAIEKMSADFNAIMEWPPGPGH